MLRLNDREVRTLGSFIEVLAAPLVYPDSGSWRREVMRSGRKLVASDRAVFGLDWEEHNVVEEEGQDPEAAPSYLSYYHRLDRSPEERRRRGRSVFSVHQQIAEGWVLDPEFKHDFLERFGLAAGAGMAWDAAPGATATVGWYSGRETPAAFAARVVPLLELAAPAFRAGVETLFRTRTFRGELIGLLDRVSDGFVLIDRSGRILHRNTSLQRTLAEDPQASDIASAVQHMARGLTATDHDVERSPFRTVSVQTCEHAYDVIPTFPGPDMSQLGVGLIVQVVRRTAAAPPAHVLRERFGLTEREADVACCLVKGWSYKRTARALAISVDTVRSHIRRLYGKLDAHTMSEAVCRLLAENSGSSRVT